MMKKKNLSDLVMRGKWEQFFSQRIRDTIRTHFRNMIQFNLALGFINALKEMLEIEGITQTEIIYDEPSVVEFDEKF